MKNTDRATYLVARAVAGESSGEELAELRQLAAADSAFAAYWETLRTARGAPWPAGEERRPDAARLLANIQRQINTPASASEAAGSSVSGRASRRHQHVSRRFFQAAVVVAVAVCGIWTARLGPALFRAIGPAHVQIYETARGQRKSVTLPDSSRVDLAPASRLTYAEVRRSGDLRVVDRTLTLVGKGFFRVRYDSARRFVVVAGRAITEDVGTTFVIDAYPEDGDVHVAVHEGQVALRVPTPGATHSTLLGAGDVAGMDSTGSAYRVSGSDAQDYLAWTGGALRLHEATLDRVAREISRWFGAEIHVEGSVLASRRLTVSIGDMPLPQLIATVAHVVHAHVANRGSSIVFTSVKQ